MCEILVAVWPEPQPFSAVLPWGLELERTGIGGFGWGVAWRERETVRRYRSPVRLADDQAGPASLLHVRSTHFLLHLRRPSQLSTVSLADTQPFVAEDGSFAFAHNGRLEGASQLRGRFADRLAGQADSEVGFRLFEALLGDGLEPAAALPEVHRQLGGTANLAYLPGHGAPLFYGGNPGNDGWRFWIGEAQLVSTALHSADQAIFSLCFPEASGQVRLKPTEVLALDGAASRRQLGVEAGGRG